MTVISFLPFELHITIKQLPAQELPGFVSFCIERDAKPLWIELARGEHVHQPMFNKVVYLSSLEEALGLATDFSEALASHHWPVQRLKIEIPATAAARWSENESGFTPYFEWHGKVQGDPTPALHELCQQHRVHLSQNALKKEENYRFITLREYGSEALFADRLAGLTAGLEAIGWPLFKQVSEYCVYDNNVYLDKGWLPQ